MSAKRILTFASAALVTAALAASLPAQQKRFERVATLGIETRTPSKEERVKYALKLEVRYQGQLVTGIAKDSVCKKAGIRRGDIILKIDRVEIFSNDDIRDVVSVRRPGTVIELLVTRHDTKKTEKVRLRLGTKQVPANKQPRLKWQYAGLPYLKEALARAKRQNTRVLVGLSGAET